MLSDTLAAKLAKRFGVPELRDHQYAGIDALTMGQGLLSIQPTAGGKSLTFWGAGAVQGGLTLVVSPLLSLMKDQVRRCEEFALPVLEWNSTVKDKAKDAIVEQLYAGWAGFLYSTPESLANRDLANALRNRVWLAAVDEAHSVLRDRAYRPKYAKLGKMLDRINPAVRMACTATLPERDRDELIQLVGLRAPFITYAPVARSGLTLRRVERGVPQLLDLLTRHDGESGVIFCATVRGAEGVYADVSGAGWSATCYHGRMRPKERKASQAAFMSSEKPIAVVTDAFLLGIDKSDIRFTVHHDPPASIEAWVQGFGRAGRDEQGATCYACGDLAEDGIRSREFLVRSSHPSVDQLRAMWIHLIESMSGYRDGSQSTIGQVVFGQSGKWIGKAAISQLERHGLCIPEPDPADGRRRRYRGVKSFDDYDWTQYEAEAADTRARFERLVAVITGPETDYTPNRLMRTSVQ